MNQENQTVFETKVNQNINVIDKTVNHPNEKINEIKQKIGLKPRKGKYAKNELTYLIWNLIWKNNFLNSSEDLEKCWKLLKEEEIDILKTHFKFRWNSYFNSVQ